MFATCHNGTSFLEAVDSGYPDDVSLDSLLYSSERKECDTPTAACGGRPLPCHDKAMSVRLFKSLSFNSWDHGCLNPGLRSLLPYSPVVRRFVPDVGNCLSSAKTVEKHYSTSTYIMKIIFLCERMEVKHG